MQTNKTKSGRLETLKMLISSSELSSQEEVLTALRREGYIVTQATLSRDLKHLKVAKAASMNGSYVYVLPNETMYRRVTTPPPADKNLDTPGFISIRFSGNMAIVRTRPGYASIIAYNIDNMGFDDILGTIAGDDTIFLALAENASRSEVYNNLKRAIPEMK